MLFLCVLLLGAPAPAAAFPSRGAPLFDTELVSGNLWGLPTKETAGRLGVSAPEHKPGLSPEWFVVSGLGQLWGLKTSTGFARIEISSGAWLLSSGGKTFGYMVKVPVDDQAFYDALARKRFGPSNTLHLEAAPPPGISDLAYFIHCVRWSGVKTNFVLLTATPNPQERVRVDQETGLVMRIKILYKKNDPDVPLYLVFWDSRRPS